jgi:hypothetical protein
MPAALMDFDMHFLSRQTAHGELLLQLDTAQAQRVRDYRHRAESHRRARGHRTELLPLPVSVIA